MSLDLPIQVHLAKSNEVKIELSDIECGIILMSLVTSDVVQS